MATRKPAKPKTSAELKKQLEEAKKKVLALEKKAYAEELSELIQATNIVEEFKKIQATVTDIKATAILSAIGDAVGIKRLDVKQNPPTPRKPVDPNKPKTPRKSSTFRKYVDADRKLTT